VHVHHLRDVTCEELRVYHTYLNNQTRLDSPDAPDVVAQAAELRSAVQMIKQRLASAGLLRYEQCSWCLTSPEAIAHAKVQSLERLPFLSSHGFHCALHAEAFHEFAQLDQNMHFSCCEAEVNASVLTAQMDNMTMED
jgi:hypothetical protein